jgi:high affinity Mn2+ porin
VRKTRKAITEDELSEWLKINKIATAEDIMDTWRFEPRFSQFQWIGEIEHRHVLWGQPEKIGVTGYVTRGRFGRWSDSVSDWLRIESTEEAASAAGRRAG